MTKLLPIACGMDVHRDFIEACILIRKGNDDPETIHKQFGTMRGDLLNMRRWLLEHNCLNVAMESTGVYWLPIYNILEKADGMNLCVVNSREAKNLPGRKDDQSDAEWIGSLFMCGLLSYSFIPPENIRKLREAARLYKKHVGDRGRTLNRIGKLLQTHGFKLTSVLSDLDGVSAMRILRRLCEEGRVSAALVRECLARGVKKTAEEIAYAIDGELGESQRVLLKYLLKTLENQDIQLAELDKHLQTVAAPFEAAINLLCSIPGIDRLGATYIIAEIGVDMDKFKVKAKWKKKEARLISWAGLCPRNDRSAGKVKSTKTNKGNSYVKSILVQCAWAVTHTRNNRLTSWYWHNVKRLGQKTAIVAVARKLLCLVFNLLSNGEVYNSALDKEATEKIEAKKLASAQRIVAKTVKHGSDGKGQKSPILSPPATCPASIPPKGSRPLILDDLAPSNDHPKKRGRPRKGSSAA